MRRPSAMTLASVAALGAPVFASCSSTPDRFVIATRTEDASSTELLPSDSGAPPTTDATGVGLCPTNECPPGRTSCAASPFPCAVDLLSDDDNCGECGNHCPGPSSASGTFNTHTIARCLSGACRMTCAAGYEDCNGLIEDGCEVRIGTNKNCATCGDACPSMHACFGGTCKCTVAGSCGTCGALCPDDTEPSYPSEWHALRTCVNGMCNQPDCEPGWGDCNDDFPGASDGDGCERYLDEDPENCGKCGTRCAPDEFCISGQCQCPCGSACSQNQIDTDTNNCGVCGTVCPSNADGHGVPTCQHGLCGFVCDPGWGDCNSGDGVVGCETNLASDPQNCGACGARCDGIEGQACVDGRCTTKECIVP